MSTQMQSDSPKHIAIIMDGNGRWATKRMLPRVAGHRAGLAAAKRITLHALECGISVLTLFAFSSENWQRPFAEVNFLMDLFLSSLEEEIASFHDQHIRVRFIGDRSNLNPRLVATMEKAEALTHENARMTLIIAIDYGGQWDIAEAVRRLLPKMDLSHHHTTSDLMLAIQRELSFADLPHPDLLIRTSGEKRISNFLLWQLAYTEFYFTEVLWPDFDEAALNHAIKDYECRDRRYGRLAQAENISCS